MVAYFQEIITQCFAKEKWLQKILSNHPDNAVVLADTQNIFHLSKDFEEVAQKKANNDDDPQMRSRQFDRLYANYCEAAIVRHVVRAASMAGIPAEAIGIIAPYVAQVELLRKCVDAWQIEVNTVDQFQGRDKPIIIYSCAKCDNPDSERAKSAAANSRDNEILEDQRRLTVAVTRAKHKLIIVGDVASLQVYTPFRQLFASISSVSKTKLTDGQRGFSWSAIMNEMQTNAK